MRQQPLVGSGSRSGLSVAGRQFPEIPVVRHIPLVDRGPGRVIVAQAEIELGIGTVFGASSGYPFGGTGAGSKKHGYHQGDNSE